MGSNLNFDVSRTFPGIYDSCWAVDMVVKGCHGELTVL